MKMYPDQMERANLSYMIIDVEQLMLVALHSEVNM